MAASVGKRILKWLAWIVGGFVSLLVVAYLALMAINWRDQPPSAAVLRFEALMRSRAPVPDADNAYPYAMGFDSVPEAAGYRESRLPGVKEFAEACRFGNQDCVVALENGETLMREWLSSEQWLLDRYLTLLRYPRWLEPVPFDTAEPLPPFGLVTDGQKLLLSKAYLLTSEQDAPRIRELLTNDVRFWRHVLASSDSLITKMIAVAALTRHFGFGNLILRKLPPELQMYAMPDEWHTPLTSDERSMLRTFVGEWNFLQHYLQKSTPSGNWIVGLESNLEQGFRDRLAARALMPFLQVQDVSNRRAELLARAVDSMDVSFERLPAVLDDLQSDFVDPMGDAGFTDWLYNPVGKAMFVVSSPSFLPYGARVSDVEGGRRIAVLATELRSKKVSAGGVLPALAASVIRAPYDGEPFAWDDKEQSIVFVGLQKGDRARQAFKY